jgi:GT2 family glycosyltransferase
VSIDLAVVNYRTPYDLAAFTASLDKYPPTVDATLTIVDVASTDAQPTTVTWARGYARRYAVNDNIGYGRACNLAAQDGAGDVIAFFNADVEVTDQAIDACHDALMARDDWAVIGPRQVDQQRRIRHAGIFGSNTNPVHRGWQETDNAQYLDIREAVTVSGSAYFIKRAVWDELTNCRLYKEIAPHAVGAFLPTPHYYEETMCSYHCRAHGHTVIYYGPVTMIHKWHRASPLGGWAEQQMPKSRAYFRYACQHHGIPCD